MPVVDSGKPTVNHKITAKIDEERRNAIRLNHLRQHT